MTPVTWLRGWLAFYAHQRDVDKLGLLSDHLLEDIGLRRDQLEVLRLQSDDVAPDTEGSRNRRAGIDQAPRSSSPRGLETSLKGCG